MRTVEVTPTVSTNKERGEKALANLERELKSRDRKDKTRPLAVAAAAAVVIVLIAGAIIWGATRSGEDEISAQDEATTSKEATSPEEIPDAEPLAMERADALPPTVSCTYEDTEGDDTEVSVPSGDDVSAEGTVNVTLKTNHGDIGMELDRSVAPCTVNAMKHLAEEDYFNDTVCHRLTTEGLHVLQCGDPTGTGTGGPGFQFANEYPTDETEESELEAPVVYPRGSIAMANSGVDTNGSQFFLNYDDSPLAPMYTYFGQIDEGGLEVLDKIAEAGVDGDAPDGQPAEQVAIEEAVVG